MTGTAAYTSVGIVAQVLQKKYIACKFRDISVPHGYNT